MRQLIIDCATMACSVALIENDCLVDERHEPAERGHAELLFALIGQILGTGKPESVLVNCGPGSFTGVRVGLAAAHGLAYGWQIPLSGYSSLAAMAATVKESDTVAIAVHGGHGQLFVQSYSCNPLAPLGDLQSLPPEEAALAVTAPLVLGSGAKTLVDIRGYGEAVDIAPRASLAHALPLALRTLAPLPIYGRLPDAKPMQ